MRTKYIIKPAKELPLFPVTYLSCVCVCMCTGIYMFVWMPHRDIMFLSQPFSILFLRVTLSLNPKIQWFGQADCLPTRSDPPVTASLALGNSHHSAWLFRSVLRI